MLERFKETKKFLLNYTSELEKSKNIDRSIIENSSLYQEIDRLEKGNFKIALVAPFSAGKSTFINSIIGKDLLSMDIRAETSVITKISYSDQIKIQVTYFENDQVEMFDTDDFGNQLTYTTCKEILKKITTVRDEKNEERIREVIVYCPLDICRDNVEIIDTPGLFSRHEKHEAITNNIIPQVNAVIFMIDPDSVGEEHFTEKIRNYVNSAKTSSLEEDGRHIFFVINKIDVFDPEDIAKARHELEQVLSGIILKPNIHEVSAYFGMRGKQLLTKDIDITEVQKDRKIKIPDPLDPEYTIAGRLITEENAVDIIKFSKIKELEKALGEYLQSKNQYLITDVMSSIRNVLSGTINKMKFEIREVEKTITEDKTTYIKKIEALQEEIESLKDETLNNVRSIINKKILGGTSGRGLDDEIYDEVGGQLVDVGKDIDREIFKKWTKAKQGVTQDNGEDIVKSVILDAEEILVLKIKELVRTSFIFIKKEISSLISDIQEQLDIVTEKLEEAELKNLGIKMDTISNMNVDNLVGSTMNKIEREFSDIIVGIAKDCQDKVQGAYNSAIYEVKKGGFINWFKGLFGKEEYEERFDLYTFKRGLDRLIEDLTESMQEQVFQSQSQIATPIFHMAQKIFEDIKTASSNIATNVIKVKENVLKDLKKEMYKNEDEKLASIGQKKQKISNVNVISQRFEEKVLQFSKEAFESELHEQSPVYQ
ncbi:dynamin family protein [Neobacillus citreus]|uniref:Dynamin family protein n=1 Tax=Neobacillus citreus TaxID=2833578 RepID=A0A942YFA5_9BACI|nr:dynamin family protein [Neobacillus citreus]MCH6266997.1 dynamin family protein [Neobacillus citreus]